MTKCDEYSNMPSIEVEQLDSTFLQQKPIGIKRCFDLQISYYGDKI